MKNLSSSSLSSLPPLKKDVGDSPQKRRVLIKGNCHECAFYDNCPRMNGKHVCFNKKELLSDDSLNS